MTQLKVAWPYITLKVGADGGGLVLKEFYAGAIVPDNADPDDRDRLVRKGALVEEDAPEAALAVPAGTPIPGEPPNVPVTEQPAIAVPFVARVDAQKDLAAQAEQRDVLRGGRPAGNASQAAWLEYAVANRPEGMPEDEAREAYGNKTRAELVTEFGKTDSGE